MSPSAETNKATAQEWRELGFYYEIDDSKRIWRLIGSREGLLNFPRLLRDYSSNPRRAPISEHDHYGPYWYLKIVTWHEPLITESDVRGALSDFVHLAELLERAIASSTPSETTTVGPDYAPKSDWSIHIEVRKDEFDPASADPLLQQYLQEKV